MSDIDWGGAYTGAVLDNVQTTRALSEARQQIAEYQQQIAALNLALRERDERIAKSEGELRHLRSREAGFLAEVRALIRENEACPHLEHHRLHVEDENRRAMLDDIFVATYDAKWDELGKA